MEVEKTVDRLTAVKYLRQIADILESDSEQQFALDDIQLKFGPDLEIEIEFEETEDRAELEIEFEWSRPQRSARRPSFDLFKGSQGQWYFNLKAPNGEIILASEAYQTRGGAQGGIQAVKTNADPSSFDRRESQAGQPYFVLTAANNKIVGVSQMYKRRQNRDKGIDAVIKYADEAEIRDRSAEEK